MKANITRSMTTAICDNAIEIVSGLFIMTLHNDFGWGETRIRRLLQKMQETGDYYKRTYQDNGTKYRGRKYQLDDTLKLALIRDLKNMNIDLTFI